MPKQVKKQKQKHGKQKQEQTVIVNVTTGKSRRTTTPVSKPQQPSISSYLALQSAANTQLLTGLSNLFAAQKNPEFTRTLSTEPIVSPPVSDKFKDIIDTTKKTTEIQTEPVARPQLTTEKISTFGIIPAEKPKLTTQKISTFGMIPAENPKPIKKKIQLQNEDLGVIEIQTSPIQKSSTETQTITGLYTNKGFLNRQSKAFKSLSDNEKQLLLEQESQKLQKITKQDIAKELKTIEKQAKVEQAAQKTEQPSKKLDLIENMKRYQQHNKTSLVEQKAPRPFENLNLSTTEEEQKQKKIIEKPSNISKRLIIDDSSEEDITFNKPLIATPTDLIENMKKYQQQKKASFVEQKTLRPFEGLNLSSTQGTSNPPL